MANIWKQNQNVNEHPNRNNFDLSFQSHSTFKFGTLYPVFCQQVVPGDSFSIEAGFNLKFMPLVFPVQSRIRAHMHFFYVRNKNLWDNWENWMQGLVSNDDHPHPYIDVNNNQFKTGSIHDFLGVPTSIVADGFPVKKRLYMETLDYDGHVLFPVYYLNSEQFAFSGASPYLPGSSADLKGTAPFITSELKPGSFFKGQYDIAEYITHVSAALTGIMSQYFNYLPSSVLSAGLASGIGVFIYNNPYVQIGTLRAALSLGGSTPLQFDWVPVDGFDNIIEGLTSGDKSLVFRLPVMFDSEGSEIPWITSQFVDDNTIPVPGSVRPQDLFVDLSFRSEGFMSYQDSGLNAFGHNGPIRLNALPYRGYMSIFNAFYRNTVVDPLIINGEKVYNKYNVNTGDGADTYNYGLYQRNYELDYLTSAFPSPQQGVAPMVGVSALGTVTVEDENGISTFKAEYDNQGNVTGNVVATSPIASVDHARIVANMVSLGFNINDFRGCNALQRILETTMRKGYKYIDFIPGHFGVTPKYNELDMPEFIGGFSRDVNVTTTYASADTFDSNTGSGASLGDYVGNANCYGGTNNPIRHYCDDYGYIIGIMSIVPTPAYSQLLRKDMICPTNFLDYYMPEMAQIGMQPITYEEVAPLQRLNDMQSDQTLRLQDTFGYQRPNYDMVARVDEVHGEFRGTLRNYLINRLFATSPELGGGFLRIEPDEVNEIFQNTNTEDDVVIGQLAFNVFAKRPLPRVHLPGLGR